VSLAECECLDADLLKQPACHLHGIGKGSGKLVCGSKIRTMQIAGAIGRGTLRMSPSIDMSVVVRICDWEVMD